MGLPTNADVTKESAAIPIEVLPLPEARKPSNFSGGVGDFTVTAQVDNNRVKTGQPITLKVRIDGKGNAKVMDFPKLDLGPNVQVYEPKINMKFFTNGRSFKEFETILVARAAGDLKIPPLSFWYFNPQTKSYVEAKTSEIDLKVDVGDGPQTLAAQKMDAPPVTKTPEIRPPQLPDLVLSPTVSSTVSARQQIFLWSAMFLLTVMGLWGYGWRLMRAKVQSEDLRQKMNRRLHTIDGALDGGRWREVGVQSTELISFMLGEVAGLGGASFDFDKLIEKAPPSFKRDLAGPLQAVMQKLAVVAYAPDEVVGALREKQNLRKLVTEVRELLVRAAEYDFTDVGRSK
jgi:hypothetical protein